jgi:hypothetical protein
MKRLLQSFLVISLGIGAAHAQSDTPVSDETALYGDSAVTIMPIFTQPHDGNPMPREGIRGFANQIRERLGAALSVTTITHADELTAQIIAAMQKLDEVDVLAKQGDLDAAWDLARLIWDKYARIVAFLPDVDPSDDGTAPPADSTMLPPEYDPRLVDYLHDKLEGIRLLVTNTDYEMLLPIIDGLSARLDALRELEALGDLDAAREEARAIMVELTDMVGMIGDDIITRPPVPGDSSAVGSEDEYLKYAHQLMERLMHVREAIDGDLSHLDPATIDSAMQVVDTIEMRILAAMGPDPEGQVLDWDMLRGIADEIHRLSLVILPSTTPSDSTVVEPDARFVRYAYSVENAVYVLRGLHGDLGIEIAFRFDEITADIETARRLYASDLVPDAWTVIERAAQVTRRIAGALIPGPIPDNLSFREYLQAADYRFDVLKALLNWLPIDLFVSIEVFRDHLDSARTLYAAGDIEAAWTMAHNAGGIATSWLTDLAKYAIPERILSPMPPIPQPPDSSRLAQTIERLGVYADSIDVRLAALSISRLDSLLESAVGQLDSATVHLDAGEFWQSGRFVDAAHKTLDRIRDAVRLHQRLTNAVPNVRARIDSLSGIAADAGIPAATELLALASAALDSVEARLAIGALRGAEATFDKVRHLLSEVNHVLRAQAELTELISLGYSWADTLATELAATPIAAGTKMLAEAVALLDTADAKLDAGRISAARESLKAAHHIMNKIMWTIELGRRATVYLDGIVGRIDSLAVAVTELPGDKADSLLAHARVLIDTVQARVDVGDMLGADAGIRHLENILQRVTDLIRSDIQLAGAIEALQGRLDDAEQLIDSSGSDKAILMYGLAVDALTKARERLAIGHFDAADASLQQAHRKLEQALFIATGPDIAARAIERLRDRVDKLLNALPADAYYERGAVIRAGEMADSAAVVLLEGKHRTALHIVERTNRALDQLVRQISTDVEPLFDLILYAREMIGMAQSLLDSTAIGTAQGDTANVLISHALALVDKVELALMSMSPMGPDMETMVAWARKARRLAIMAYDTLVSDVAPTTPLDEEGFVSDAAMVDPIMADIVGAAEKAARDAGTTDIDDATPSPTILALSNAPNPFNPSTVIRYVLPTAGEVQLTLYNVLGQEVRILIGDYRAAGMHEVVWDGRDRDGRSVSSGVYIARLVTRDAQAVSRLLMAR